MAVGILADHHMDFVSGTACMNDQSDIPQGYENLTRTQSKHGVENYSHVDMVPQLSDFPNDLLNWSTWKKAADNYLIGLLCIFNLQDILLGLLETSRGVKTYEKEVGYVVTAATDLPISHIFYLALTTYLVSNLQLTAFTWTKVLALNYSDIICTFPILINPLD